MRGRGAVTGRVYTETVVHAAPAALVSEAPYQLAIIDLIRAGEADPAETPAATRRVTARILAGPNGERAQIGDLVEQTSVADGVAIFRRID